MLRKNLGLILILIVAIFLRFVKLDYLEMFGDELDAGYQAYSLGETGRDYKGNLLPTYAHSFSEWRAPLMMYAMIPFVKVFGLNEYGVRGYSAFFGVLSILGLYFLLKVGKVNKSVALVSCLLLAIIPWHIQYSRSAFELTLLSSLIIFGFYFFIRYLERKKMWMLIGSAVLLSLSFYTYNTANVYVPLIITAIFVISWFINKKLSFRPFLNLLVIMFFLSLPILVQIFSGHGAERFKKFSVFNNDNMVSTINTYRTEDKNSSISKFYYNKPVLIAKTIAANYANAFSSDFLFGRGDVTFRHSLHMVGNLFWVQAILIVLGVIVFIKKKEKVFGDYLMIGLLIISPIPSSLTVDGAYHASRLFLMVFPLVYFSAIGLLSVFKYKRIIGWLVVLVMFFEFTYYQYYYWTSYGKESWRWWHFGYKQTIQLVGKYEGNYKKLMLDNTYEPSLIRYLFWNKVDPRLVLGFEDKTLSEGVDGYDGFCLNEKACFVDFKGRLSSEKMKDDALYVINQQNNVGGDWDWSKNTPEGIRVLEVVRDPKLEPLFYLVEKS